ncbi:hypothetical protein O6H91_12G050400 [Diphasiastrum complanatum]|uniref:Uncharacterized protein n=1 Tax=Diphasiastrum complanatum TaxID=34168 RepID=A0ACC2C1L2_DIPCM|nr:hypothetical protein O6H91_12G050400 [Diphasiastrum complanatum]
MGEEHVDPLDALRPLMESYSPPLHALVIPSEDAHQSEYVADRDKRREFVSHFTGSAGLAVITKDEALLWTDGRYFLQATQQLSSRWKLMRIGEDPTVETWLSDNLSKDSTVGVDPWCISVDTAKRWEQAFAKKEQKLIQLHHNLVDAIWENRPPERIFPVRIQSLKFTGLSAKEKIKDLRSKLAAEKAFAIVISTLDEVAWLFNLRGSDVLYNPVVHAFGIVTLESACYYVDKRKIGEEVEKYLTENGVEIRSYEAILHDVECLGLRLASKSQHDGEFNEASNHVLGETSTVIRAIDVRDKDPKESKNVDKHPENIDENELLSKEEQSETLIPDCHTDHDSIISEKFDTDGAAFIWVDSATCSLIIYTKLHVDQVILQQSPIALAKALKHPVELEGLRNAHIRDGVAVVSYLAWLDGQMQELYGAAGYFLENGSHKRKRTEEEKLTEVSVSDKLEEFRSKQQHFMGLSFETISSVGSNAAIIHYAPKPESCAELHADSMYLCDSGGQYLDGTTDVTRTVHFGKPSAHEKECFTQVLQGHIGLDTAVFPNGTTGHALDILARVPLWKYGLDYRHGTGHGVGSFLNVHEGPHLISFRPQARNVAIQASMTVTDEPGYYEDGNFGIRLENVLIVKEARTAFNFGDKGYLAFEHITWVPFQAKLIDLPLLSPIEMNWVDQYHAECRDKLSPYLSGSELEWLVKATEPLPRELLFFQLSSSFTLLHRINH